MVSKLFLHSNAVIAKSGTQSMTFKSVTKKQIDKQKTQRFWLPRRRVKSEPTTLGTVIEDLEHVFAPRKKIGVWRIVSPLGGAEYLGVTRPPQLKTPITPYPLEKIQRTRPEMWYKFFKFCETRARDTLVVYSLHFGQIWVKISVCGVLHPCRCTDGGDVWHGGVDRSSPACQISPPSVQRVAAARRKTSKLASE